MARLYGLILNDIFPERKADFNQRAQTIATDMVHHPTDIKARQGLGDQLYKEFQKSSMYQKALLDVLKARESRN